MLTHKCGRIPLMMALAACLGAERAALATPTLSLQVGSDAAYSVTLTYVSANSAWEFHSGANDVDTTGLLSNGKGLFTVDVAVKDNSPGGTTAQLLNTTTDVRDNGHTTAPNSLVLTVSESAFTSPVGTNLSL